MFLKCGESEEASPGLHLLELLVFVLDLELFLPQVLQRPLMPRLRAVEVARLLLPLVVLQKNANDFEDRKTCLKLSRGTGWSLIELTDCSLA